MSEQLVAAMKLALYELRAIQARDGAPQHISWDLGRPIQTDSCTHEWWSELVEICDSALSQATNKKGNMAYDPDVLAVAVDRAKGFKLTDAETVSLAQEIQNLIREEIKLIMIARKHAKR